MADQTVTFTKRAGVTSGPEKFTVTISEDDGNATNVSDGEANQAMTRARAAQSGVDLSNYDMSVGSTAVARDRYTTLLGGSSAGAPGNPAAPTDLVPAPRASGLWSVGGAFRFLVGLGADKHIGPGGEITVASQWNKFEAFRPQVIFGLATQTASKDFALPGSKKEDANSRFNLVGPLVGFGARSPIAARNRLALDYALIARLGYAWTPGSTMGTVKGGGGQVCYDSGAGRQQCEERGDGSPTNLGKTGGYVPGLGNSVSQSGLGLDVAIRLMLNYGIPIKSGAVNLAAGVDLGNFSTHTGAASRGDWYLAPGLRVHGEF